MGDKEPESLQFCELFVNGRPLGRATQMKVNCQGTNLNLSQFYKPIELKATVKMDPETSDHLRKMMEEAIPSELYNLLQKVNKLADQYHQEKWKGRRHRRELQRQYDKLYKRFDHYCKIYGVTYSVAH